MSEDEGISTPVGSSLAYHEFELIPKMRETYNAPNPSKPIPDFGEMYAQH
jgi:hypothetical protein